MNSDTIYAKNDAKNILLIMSDDMTNDFLLNNRNNSPELNKFLAEF